MFWGLLVNRIKQNFVQFCSIVLIILFSASLLRADVTGSISGLVRDRSQAVVVGAKVVITNTDTNQSQTATTGADGTYRFLALPVGHYKITISADGFRP